MIAYKDFKRSSRMLGLSQGPFDGAVEEANQWITSNRIDVINAETLFSVTGGGGTTNTTENGVRIWYKDSPTTRSRPGQ